MSQTIVQINFDVSIPHDAFEQAVMPDSGTIAAVDGLQWKIWAMNDATQEFAGTYLFTNEATADAYVNGPIVANLKAAPVFSNVVVRSYAVMETLTAITRGPIKEAPVMA